MTIDEYILEKSTSVPDYLNVIERNTYLKVINPRMCSGALQGRVLSMLTKMISPTNILELGTFTGYSALCMAEGLSKNGTIDTIEQNDELEDFIRENIHLSPYTNQINLHIGRALEIIPQLQKEFDLVFIDADKREYCAYYDQVLPLIRKEGYIIADNTLWNNKVLETEIDERDKQTLEIMRFNDMLKNDKRVEVVILPVRDGLTVIKKK
ncbi:MAG: methyltransferase [Paludibacter sp.]|nr:MAG: methyltransferase [Paludibacter sp.]